MTPARIDKVPRRRLSRPGAAIVLSLAVVLALWRLPVSANAAPPGPDDFAGAAPVTGSLQPGKLAVFPIPADVLALAEPSGGDIRLFDRDGREVPLVILQNTVPPQPERLVVLEPEEYGEDEGTISLLLARPEGTAAIQGVRLEVAGRDFQVRAELLAGEDKKLWSPLATGVLYDASATVGLRQLALSFAPSQARYYLLRLWEDPAGPARTTTLRRLENGLRVDTIQGGHGLPFTLKSVQAVTDPKRDGHVQTEDARLEIAATRNAEGRTSLDFSTTLPVEKLRLAVADAYYQRRATVWARDDQGRLPNAATVLSAADRQPDTQGFRLVGQGVLRNAQVLDHGPVQDTLPCRSGRYGQWRLVIENGDSPPLTVTAMDALWTQRLGFFLPTAETGYTLRFGRPGTAPPVYDLARSVRRDNWWALPVQPATLGPVTRRDGATRPGAAGGPPPWLLPGVIAALCLGMGLWIVRLLRSGPQSDDKTS